jgi:hypothetical protein
MEESYMEGVTDHHGPRSCVAYAASSCASGEVSLTSGESVSWVLSSESISLGLPACLLDGTVHASRSARTRGPR